MGVRDSRGTLVVPDHGNADRGGADAESADHLAGLIATVAPDQARDLAIALLTRWRTIGRVLATSEQRLRQDVPAPVAAVIAAGRAASLHALRRQLVDRPLIASWAPLNDYVFALMAHETTEQMHMLLLDSRLRLIVDEAVSYGSISEVAPRPREIVRRCLDLGAAGVILAHNHPSGISAPSRSDANVTRQLSRVLSGLEIELHDHLIVAAGGITSMRAMGLMEP